MSNSVCQKKGENEAFKFDAMVAFIIFNLKIESRNKMHALITRTQNPLNLRCIVVKSSIYALFCQLALIIERK